MKQALLSTLLCLMLATSSYAQVTFQHPEVKQDYLTHAKRNWLLGTGITYVGLTAKAGRFVANRVWLGAEGEFHIFLSTRYEGGIFARYYTGERMVNGFVGTGLSYGSFERWFFDIDRVSPYPNYQSFKLNALAGLEIRLTKRVSIEGVAKVGRLTATNWVQPSLQGSLNFYLGQ